MSSSYIDQDQVEENNKDYKDLWHLLPLFKPYRWMYLGGLLLLISSGWLVILSSRYMGKLIEDGLKNLDQSYHYATIIVALECSAMLALWLGRRTLANASGKSILAIRRKAFAHLGNLPMIYFDKQPQGRIVTRITHEIEGLEDFLSGGLGRMANAFIIFLTALIAMLATSFQIGLVMCLFSLPALYLTLGFQKNVRNTNRQISRLGAICNAQLAEFINGMSVVRTHGLEQWSIKRYAQKTEDWRQSVLIANRFYTWNRPVLMFMCQLPLFTLFILVGTNTLTEGLSVGIIVALVRYCERFTSPMITVAREFNVIQQAFTSAERISTFFKEETEEKLIKQTGEFKPDSLRGEITFQDVSMGYDSKTKVLKDINFSIRPGEKIGLVGATGSGKSTTVSLICRLYEYQEGEIFIDHHPIHQYDKAALRRHIGFVSQDAVLFKATIRDNLQAELHLSDEQITIACQKTGLLEIMNRRDLTLDSWLSENGDNLSQGEKQLLALTRILLKDPAILILDEATANVDPYFEEIIHRAVDSIMKGRTSIIIAHRLGTIQDCDRLFVFEQGELKEHGTNQELMDQKGLFHGLVNSYH